MMYINSKSLKWEYLKKNDIHVGRSSELIISDLLDIVHIKIEPLHTLPAHYHNRPQDGHEVLYFPNGGNISVKDKNNKETIYNNGNSFYIIIGSGIDETHSICNLSTENLEFICICSPKFTGPEEEVFV